MYVVTRDGVKLLIDASKLPEDFELSFHDRTVGLYDDDMVLKDVWILELSRRGGVGGAVKDFELNFVKDIRFDHEPTKEEILYAMSQYGCSRFDFAIVRKGFKLDWDSY